MSTTENSTKSTIPGTESRRLAGGPDNDGQKTLHTSGSDDEMAIQKKQKGDGTDTKGHQGNEIQYVSQDKVMTP